MPLYTKDNLSVYYIHVPKTGGTAIHTFFQQNGFRVDYRDPVVVSIGNKYRRCSPQHMHAEQILSVLRPHKFDFIFMTVREPVSRLLSEYKWRMRMSPKIEPLEPWFRRMTRAYLDDNYVGDNHIRPQSHFWLPTCRIHRHEDGYETSLVEQIEERFRLRFEHRIMPRENTTEKQAPDLSGMERLLPDIKAFYAEDFIRFGYQP